MPSSDSNLAAGKAPQFIRISIDQIDIPRSNFGEWTNDGGYYPMSVPSVTKEALELLQFIQPILVARAGKKNQPDSKNKEIYTLLAGRRTLQLLIEQLTLKSKIWTIRIENKLSDDKPWEVMDMLSTLLLRRPDEATKALLAHKLHHEKGLHDVAQNFLDITNTNKISSLLGMSRATFNRAIKEVAKHEAEKKEVDISQKTTLGLAGDSEPKDI